MGSLVLNIESESRLAKCHGKDSEVTFQAFKLSSRILTTLRQAARLSRRVPHYARTFTTRNGSQIEDELEVRGYFGVLLVCQPESET